MIQHCQKVWQIHWKIFLKRFIVDVLIISTATAEKMITADSSIHVHSVRFQYIVAQTVNNNIYQFIVTFVNLKNRSAMIIMKFMKHHLEEVLHQFTVDCGERIVPRQWCFNWEVKIQRYLDSEAILKPNLLSWRNLQPSSLFNSSIPHHSVINILYQNRDFSISQKSHVANNCNHA